MKIRLLYALSALYMGAILCGCSGAEKLSWTLQPGKTYTAKVNMISDLHMMFPNVDHKQAEVILTCRVKSAQPQQATLDVTIGSIKASMKSLSKSFSYDSSRDKGTKTTPKGNAGQAQRFINAFASLPGKHYQLKVDLQNHQARIMKMDPALKKIAYGNSTGDMFGGDQVKMLFLEANLIEYPTAGLYATSTLQPKKQVKWQAPAAVVVPYAKVTILRKNYVTEPVASDKNNDNIKMDCTIEPVSLTKEQEKTSPYDKIQTRHTFNIDHVTGQGSLLYSVARGQPIKLSDKVRLDISSRQSPRAAKTPSGKERPKPKMFYVVQKTVEYTIK